MEAIKTVLYVEDDLDDSFFFRRALRSESVACNLQVVADVATAKSYLSGEERYHDRNRFPMPDLLLTDSTIKNPGGSSLDLISWIRTQPSITRLPIICITGNTDPEILRQFLNFGAPCHFKTPDMVDIARKVKAALAALP